ncbi:TPA: arginine--tRNA ligase [Staphylococcus delphini]|uniref:arginine--tRNA ligase n=1 Tax=Staphylococcus delphini TaxID=53344 RepID=UPI000BBC5049|nr:arginine--tRNA ligase [Staphylococcus delphini]PCF47976.1 arginine--tRNA ligase [Staphylococcus delphini]PCF77523.1 arginine--tRNA ligase [Staphylococcus delphini]HEC2154417.1 arginine--tRNA ligase [Staphylococcus delphini]HEC2174655.1 arginine--tRNA ligase [Staphylococcus delphini]
MFKQSIAKDLYQILQDQMTFDEIYQLIEYPANENHGEYSFPTFQLAKIFKKPPVEIANSIKEKFDNVDVRQTEVVNGFLNFFLDRDVSAQKIIAHFGNGHLESNQTLSGEKIVIDYSSPNIAKPFSMGHLRATVLGDSLSKILEANGAEVIKINHLGDWGTQFGKLIVAYQKWGDAKKVEENPIKELFYLYTKFHEVSEEDPQLDAEAREAFRLLESGNDEYEALWSWFREVSMTSFNALYKLLDIHFDYIQSEAFYNDKLTDTVKLLEQKGLLKRDDGAYIVELEDLPPALIKKSDGASLYITRDLSAVLYRTATFDPTRILYVVGQEQSIHFKQLEQVTHLLGLKTVIEHVPFGLILQGGKKMSTRQGKVVLLEDIIAEVEAAVLKTLEEKQSQLTNKQETAREIAIASVKFYDLKNDRLSSYDFRIDEMLAFEGDTALYIMYTYARMQSILRKSGYANNAKDSFQFEENMWAILKHLKSYHEVLEIAAVNYTPSSICRYTLQLCRHFNSYYNVERILGSENEKSKMILLEIVSKNIEEAMQLLGIKLIKEI